MLSLDVEKRLAGLTLKARFSAATGVTALFGPSGAGKTSIVNMIAGLLTPDRGRIVVGDRVVFDAAIHVTVPAYRRGIGYVFQDSRLFPHLTVRQNLSFGRWMRGLPRDPQEDERVLAMLDLAPILHRRPGRLSGGERQRVAIGRALLMRPRLLLLDEPLASLDATRKAEIFPYLERLRDDAGVPIVYVSHHLEEVRRIANAAVRIEAGRVTAVGGVELLSAPPF